MASAEQQARDMLDRMGVPDAQSYSSGDLVELANLIADSTITPQPPMTDQHRATPEQWAAVEEWGTEEMDNTTSCILELRARVEALAAAQQSAPAPPREIELELTRKVLVGDLTLAEATERLAKSSQVAAQHGPAPTASLVERVANLLDPDEPICARGTARAAIREVAAWLRDAGDDFPDGVALLLEQEANQ